jgi:hypothetical protein
VRVLTIHPGFVAILMTAHLQQGPLSASPENVAQGILKAIARRKDVVCVCGVERLPRPPVCASSSRCGTVSTSIEQPNGTTGGTRAVYVSSMSPGGAGFIKRVKIMVICVLSTFCIGK